MVDALSALKEAVRDIPGRLFIAYSGGADSRYLLRLARHLEGRDLILCHFDHAWSEHSGQWAHQARLQAEQWDIPFASKRDPAPVISEAGARRARYAFFEELLSPGDAMLMGHHRLDQLETRWMRCSQGRPPRGMPQRRRLGQGWLIRPLLGCDPVMDASAVQDPANQDPRYRRVQVRQRIVQAPDGLVDSLERLGHVYDRLEALVGRYIPQGSYRYDPALPPNLQVHAINAWIWQQARLAAPPIARVQALISQLPAKPDRQPALQWSVDDQRWALRWYAGYLHLEPAVWVAPQPTDEWRPLASGQAAKLHAHSVPPWHRPWAWQHAETPKTFRWWRPKVEPGGKISLEYIDLND